MSGQLEASIKRWTAKRKSALVIEIIQDKTTVAEVSRTYDLTPSEIKEWVDDARWGMENTLRARGAELSFTSSYGLAHTSEVICVNPPIPSEKKHRLRRKRRQDCSYEALRQPVALLSLQPAFSIGTGRRLTDVLLYRVSDFPETLLFFKQIHLHEALYVLRASCIETKHSCKSWPPSP